MDLLWCGGVRAVHSARPRVREKADPATLGLVTWTRALGHPER